MAADPTAIYWRLYRDALSRAWSVTTRHAWTYLVPVIVLSVGVVLEQFVRPLDERFAPLIMTVCRAILWAGYFYVLRRLAVGARTELDQTLSALRNRALDLNALLGPVITGSVVFLALEYTGCLGVLALSAIGISPVIELLALRDEDPPVAVSEGFRFLKNRPVSWGVVQFFMLSMISIMWMIVVVSFAIPFNLFAEELSWVSGFAGAILMGPVLHLFFVFRAILFLELERTTHAQRMYRANTERA